MVLTEFRWGEHEPVCTLGDKMGKNGSLGEDKVKTRNKAKRHKRNRTFRNTNHNALPIFDLNPLKS